MAAQMCGSSDSKHVGLFTVFVVTFISGGVSDTQA